MSYIQGPLPPTGPDPIQPRTTQAEPPERVSRTEPQDSVSISEIARWKERLSRVPEVRESLVAAVRAEIEAGTYDTIDKVRVAAEKLLAELKEEGIL